MALLLAAVMTFAVAGCGEEDDYPDEVIEGDNSVMAMRFTPPEEYETLERTVEQKDDGTVTEKYMVYTLAGNEKITYQYMTGIRMADVVNKKKSEKLEQDGQTFYLKKSEGLFQAFAKAGDAIYGIRCSVPGNEKGREVFDSALAGVSFSETDRTDVNELTVCALRYKLDSGLPVISRKTGLTQDAGGRLLRKSLMMKFGEAGGKVDFRFEITAYRHSTVKEVIGKKQKYKYKKIGDIEYAFLKAGDDPIPFAYYTQHGDDVYEIINRGVTDGLFTTRSMKSEEAFNDLIHSVYFV